MQKDEFKEETELRNQVTHELLLQAIILSISLHMTGFKVLPFLLHMFIASINLKDCSAIDTVTITEPLQDPSFLVSSDKTFKLGFFSPENTTKRYVGIMYNVPKMPVLWVANRNNPLNDPSGVLTASEDGNLVVLNGKKEILWSSDAGNAVPGSTAQLLDNGNLVLRENTSRRSVWESFQIPTNCMVTGMRLGGSRNGSMRLTSWRNPSDPSVGNFSFGMDPLRMPEFLIWNQSQPYWRSGPWNGNVFIGVPGMSSAYENRFELVDDNMGSVYFTHAFLNDSVLFYYELSSSGVLLEKMSYFETDVSKLTWSSLKNECDVYGRCGPFGICNNCSTPICMCLQGFEPRERMDWDRGNWVDGCSRKTMLKCDGNDTSGQEGKPDSFLKLSTVKVPDFGNLLELLKAPTEEECGNQCLRNCSCSAFSYNRGIGCMHWSGSLLDIRQFTLDGTDLNIRLAYSEIDPKFHTKGKRKKILVISSIAIIGSLFVVITAFLVWKFLTKHRDILYRKDNVLDLKDQTKIEELPSYSFEILSKATNHFHLENKLGQGGFGPVYKGKLLNGQENAVKRLSNSSSQRIKELTNEIVLISKLQHRNLVRVLGCCFEGDEKMLVYEYMPNKSLDAYLFDLKKCDLLDWSQRMLIIEGIGRGLLYLHRDSRLKIIHRDLKASNILLDEELNPKISDFGLARIFGGNQDQASTKKVVGTFGYMAPEYAMRGKISEKSDVYSFGVLLLEIVSGKGMGIYKGENDLSLIGYTWKLWNDNEATKLLYPPLYDPSNEMDVLRYIHVGLLCVQESPEDRPNVSTALSMLNSEIFELPSPKLPAYTARLCIEPSQHNLHSFNNVTLTTVQGR